MTRPPADEIERKAVEALKVASHIIKRDFGPSDFGIEVINRALSAYTTPKEVIMPSWEDAWLHQGGGISNNCIHFGDFLIHKDKYNAIREALAREVK